jgi:hypothetical protein
MSSWSSAAMYEESVWPLHFSCSVNCGWHAHGMMEREDFASDSQGATETLLSKFNSFI